MHGSGSEGRILLFQNFKTGEGAGGEGGEVHGRGLGAVGGVRHTSVWTSLAVLLLRLRLGGHRRPEPLAVARGARLPGTPHLTDARAVLQQVARWGRGAR